MDTDDLDEEERKALAEVSKHLGYLVILKPQPPKISQDVKGYLGGETSFFC